MITAATQTSLRDAMYAMSLAKAVPDVPIQVLIRNAPVNAVTVATPFYKRAKS